MKNIKSFFSLTMIFLLVMNLNNVNLNAYTENEIMDPSYPGEDVSTNENMGLYNNQNTRADVLPEEPNPVFNGSQKLQTYGTTNLKDQFHYQIDGLSFKNTTRGINFPMIAYGLGEDNQSHNPSAKLNKIIIPAFSGIPTNQTKYDKVSVRIMGTQHDLQSYSVIKQISSDNVLSQTGFELTRDEILAWSTDGEMPKEINIFLIPGDTSSFDTLEEFKLDGPIEFVFDSVDNAGVVAGRAFQYYPFAVHWDYTTAAIDHVKKENYHYNYFDLSTASVEANKTTDLNPGDEVELTFSITNPTAYTHKFIYVGFEAENISFVSSDMGGDIQIPFTSWKQNADWFYSAFVSATNTFVVLDPHQTLTFKVTVKINDDFTGRELPLTPFKFQTYDQNIKRGEMITLKINQPMSYQITYDGNGATEGAVPIDLNTYAEADILVVAEPGDLATPNARFIGWNTKADATGTMVMPGDSHLLSALIEDELDPLVTLYAIWEPEPVVEKQEKLVETGQNLIEIMLFSSLLTLSSIAALIIKKKYNKQ